MFVQVLAVLITVLVGFGYAYARLQNGSSGGGDAVNNAVNIEFDMLYASLMISMVLLSLAIALIVSMAYGFRRDQTTACRIRVNAGAMKAWKDSDDRDFYFPAAYNPIEKTGCCWMPEYHNIFYIALLALKVILVVIVINKACSIDSLDKHGFLFWSSIIAVIISFVSDIFVWNRYKKKWKGVAKKARKILQSKSKVDAQD